MKKLSNTPTSSVLTKRKRDAASSRDIRAGQDRASDGRDDVAAPKADALARLNADVLRRTFSYLSDDVPTLKALRQVSRGLRADVAELLPEAAFTIAAHEVKRVFEDFDVKSVPPALAATLSTLTRLDIPEYPVDAGDPRCAGEYVLKKLQSILEYVPKLTHLSLCYCCQATEFAQISSWLEKQDGLVSLTLDGYLDVESDGRALCQLVRRNDALATVSVSEDLISEELLQILSFRTNLVSFPFFRLSDNSSIARQYVDVLKNNKGLENLAICGWQTDRSKMDVAVLNEALAASYGLENLKFVTLDLVDADRETVEKARAAAPMHRALQELNLWRINTSRIYSLLAAEAYLLPGHELKDLDLRFRESPGADSNVDSPEALNGALSGFLQALSAQRSLSWLRIDDVAFRYQHLADLFSSVEKLEHLKHLDMSFAELDPGAGDLLCQCIGSLKRLEYLSLCVGQGIQFDDMKLMSVFAGVHGIKRIRLHLSDASDAETVLALALACRRLPALETLELRARSIPSAPTVAAVRDLFSRAGTYLIIFEYD